MGPTEILPVTIPGIAQTQHVLFTCTDHEYMHVLGFFHTDYKDDVAHQTGWIGYYILLDWKQKGIEAMTLKPGDL